VKLIVGLGNPGNKYKNTRHNIGYTVCEQLSETTGFSVQKTRFKCVYNQGIIAGSKVIVAKPITFMNLSGEAVSTIANYYKISTNNIIIIHDDMDIEFGHIKIKSAGSSAGHRGLDSIIHHLKDKSFLRIRIGISKPPEHMAASDFVLQRFSNIEQKILGGLINTTVDCIKVILDQGAQTAMNRFHKTRKISVQKEI
jgi:peptidyl-tRNA hydrolase, PTH1 family